MRNFGIAAALAAASLSVPAFAQTTDSEAFQIQGTVPVECIIINNSVAAVEVVTLDGTEQTLGSFTYRCNLRGGFSRTISSANSGNLVDGAGGDISYNFAHGGGSGLDQASVKLSAPVTESFGGSSAFVAGQTGSLRVTPSSGAGEFAGTYTDTITVEITG